MGRLIERLFWLFLLAAPAAVGLALAAPSGTINYAAINGVTGTLSYAPTTGAFSQAACANLSNAGTACPANTGTSGGTLGLLNANKTDSGTNVWSGQQSVSVETISAASSTLTPTGTKQDYIVTLVHANTPFTLANMTGTPPGNTHGIIKVIQSSSGSDLISTWGSAYQAPGGTATIVLSTGANAVDILAYVSDGTNVFLTPLLNFSH